jgi:hypothetical protein
MRNSKISSILVTMALALLAAPTTAQTTQKPRPGTATHKAVAAAKPAPVPVPAPSKPVELTAEQISIAQIVHTGRIACADGQSVTITPDAKVIGGFDLLLGKTKYDVVPVPTKSGAVRLEDSKSGIVFMQLANKSMLFNERQGKRLADDCINPAQQAVADAMRANPTAGVLDGLSK